METIAGAVVGFLIGLMAVALFRLSNEVGRLRRNVAAIARHLNVDLAQPPVMSDRVKELARDPGRKIEAIKWYREETGASLAEAKRAVEEYIRSQGL